LSALSRGLARRRTTPGNLEIPDVVPVDLIQRRIARERVIAAEVAPFTCRASALRLNNRTCSHDPADQENTCDEPMDV
jgi:hypothetical protein